MRRSTILATIVAPTRIHEPNYAIMKESKMTKCSKMKGMHKLYVVSLKNNNNKTNCNKNDMYYRFIASKNESTLLRSSFVRFTCCRGASKQLSATYYVGLYFFQRIM